jgi:hypothetical protein
MSDRPDDTAGSRDADELTAAVSDLGDTDRLDAVRERNESLEERLPGDENLPRTHRSPEQG